MYMSQKNRKAILIKSEQQFITMAIAENTEQQCDRLLF